MRRVVVFVVVVFCFSFVAQRGLADVNHLLKLQRALQDVIISARHADDLAQSIFRFLVKSNPDDTLEALEASIRADVLLHSSRQRSEKLMQSLRIVFEHDSESIGTVLRKMGPTLKKMLSHDFMFPKLMELGGFTRMEVNMMFQMGLGRNPTINLIRLKELGIKSVPDFEKGFSGDLFFQLEKFRITLNPPIAGLSRELYKGVQVIDETGQVIKRIPLENARGIESLTQRIDDLITRASQDLTDAKRALRGNTASDAGEFTAELARKADDLATIPQELPRIAINKETMSLAGKRMHRVDVRVRDGSEMTVRLNYNPHAQRLDFDQVVITQNMGGEPLETLMQWRELKAFLNDDHTFNMIKDYLLSQRATGVFRRP